MVVTLCGLQGRKPNTKKIGLEAVGVELDGQGAVRVSIRCFVRSVSGFVSAAASLACSPMTEFEIEVMLGTRKSSVPF